MRDYDQGYLRGYEKAKEDFARPHGEWQFKLHGNSLRRDCSNCGTSFNADGKNHRYCSHCGALMSANDRQVTGKLNEEPKDSHSEYWNSIGEWKEGESE